MSDVKVFRLDRDAVLKRLREYASSKANENMLAIVLIGSLARGDHTAFSDADIVVIVREDLRRIIDRSANYIETKLGIDVEPRVYTLEEIMKMCRERRRIIEEIVRHGILLAGDPGVVEMLKGCV
ncbi:MAG: nucleotidyltransferase domain-containing protein [Desulfurococcales archaeon]|nr:nucleotidyltransferase domain-containing protein [Desulfurococcales archaeon]